MQMFIFGVWYSYYVFVNRKQFKAVSTYLSSTKYRSKAPWQELSSSSSSCSSGSALADGEESKNNPNKTRTRRMFNKNLAIVFPRGVVGKKVNSFVDEKEKKNKAHCFSVFLHPRDSYMIKEMWHRQKKGCRRCLLVSFVWSSVCAHDHPHPGQKSQPERCFLSVKMTEK